MAGKVKKANANRKLRMGMVGGGPGAFALGGGSTGICREGLAALLGGSTSDVRFVMLRARAALLHAENIDRCEVHRAVHKAMLA